MVIFGVVFFAVFIVSLLVWVKQDGLMFVFNFGRIGFLIWCLALGLYNIRLTDLYSPSLSINIVSCIVIINFWIVSKVFKINTLNEIEIFRCDEEISSGYKLAIFFTFCLAVLSFFVNYREGNLRYFTHMSTRQNFALGYFLHLSTIVALYFWIKARNCSSIVSSIKYFIMVAICLFMIMADLSRSPLILFSVGVSLFEVSKYMSKNKIKSRKKLIWFVLFAIIVLFLFGYIGNIRTVAIFEVSIASFYNIKVNISNELAWIYMYITSPLENTRYILDNQFDVPLSWGNRLLYPVIKFICNFFGIGDAYRNYVSLLPTMPVKLNDYYGLNASTFISMAIMDFGVLGIGIYILAYYFIAYVWKKIVTSRRSLKTSKLIITALMFQIPLFSSFTNSIFGIAFIWVNIFFVLFWDYMKMIKLKNAKLHKKTEKYIFRARYIRGRFLG